MARLVKRPLSSAPPSTAPHPAPPDPLLTALQRREEVEVVKAEVDEGLVAHLEKWDRIREQAAAMGEGMMGPVRWVESKAVAYGYPPLDPWWAWHFDEFYASGKLLDLGCVGLRGAKSHSNCYAIVAESLFRQRTLLPGLVGVCPVLAQRKTEADDRLSTISALLLACGIVDISGKRGASVDKFGGFDRSGSGAGGGILALRDSQGHEIEFRVSTCSISGAAGFTGIAGFCDEVDLWGRDVTVNPADQVLSTLATRFTTQPGAVYHVMSATYPDQRPSCFDDMVKRGDDPMQYVAKLGEAGAAKDHAARRALAARLVSQDPLLLAPPDPKSTSIPSWVTNPIVTIDDCYAKSGGNIKAMFQRFGGREGKRTGSAGHGDFMGLADAVRNLRGQGNPWPGFTDIGPDPYQKRRTL